MQYLSIDSHKLSRLALGTDGYGLVAKNDLCHRMLDMFIDQGGTVIDTALSYSGDEHLSEKCIGAWLLNTKKRDSVFLSTKGGFPPLGHMEISRLSEKELRHDIQESLKNLKVDYVDIYWLHRDDTSLPVGELAEITAAFVKEGKTRYIGLSNWRGDRIHAFNHYAEAHDLPRACAAQIQFTTAKPNIANIDPTLVVMDRKEAAFYTENPMPVFAFSSQAKGYFYKLEQGLPLSQKAEVRFDNEVSRKRFMRLSSLAKAHNVSIGQAATAVLTSIEAFPVIPILGCKTEKQLASSLAAADLVFSAEEVQFIFSK